MSIPPPHDIGTLGLKPHPWLLGNKVDPTWPLNDPQSSSDRRTLPCVVHETLVTAKATTLATIDEAATQDQDGALLDLPLQ